MTLIDAAWQSMKIKRKNALHPEDVIGGNWHDVIDVVNFKTCEMIFVTFLENNISNKKQQYVWMVDHNSYFDSSVK